MAATTATHSQPASARPSPANHAEQNRQPSVADLPPPATHPTTAAPVSKKSKSKKNADPVDSKKAIEDTIRQLEQSRAGDREQELEIEREVRKHTREQTSQLASLDPMARIDALQRKYSELLAEMKRTEREHIKAKKRADQLQKEKDTNRTELTKMTTVKEKLEKLCRELQKDNKKLKVGRSEETLAAYLER